MLNTYKYPLKVWLTACVLGTIFYFTYIIIYDLTNSSNYTLHIGETTIWMIITLLYSILLSSPCWIVLWLLFIYFTKNVNNLAKLNVLLIITSQCLCWLCFYLLLLKSSNASFSNTLEITLPFSLALLLSSIFFNVKKVKIKI